MNARLKIIRLACLFLVCAGAVWLCWPALTMGRQLAQARMTTQKFTVEERVEQFAPVAVPRLKPCFDAAQIAWPPAQIALLGFKQEKRLEVHAAGADGRFRFIRSYPFTATSGQLGPKLREGDRQIPEGFYGIESLNPNSLYHLSLRVNYPNSFDRELGREDGRKNLGGDIMIHGRSVTIGCIPVGDPAIEELFVLAALTGIEKIQVIISPVDFRTGKLPADMPVVPAWTEGLYAQIARALA
ncbi:L,D-transpeptidase family protein, partial [Geitlerinema calcuttense]